MNKLQKIKRDRILKEFLRGFIVIVIFLVILYAMLSIIKWS
jgi:hypothetical protein